MTASPLAAVACGFSIDDGAHIIQWHLLGMFAPSFFSGKLVARFGVLRVLSLGIALMAACVAIATSSTSLPAFHVALLALGIGWNILIVCGTTLLSRSYRPNERGKTQALSGLLGNLAATFSTLSAGAALEGMGWSAVTMRSCPCSSCASRSSSAGRRQAPQTSEKALPDRLVVMIAYAGVNLIDIAGPLQAFESANCRLADEALAPTYRLVTASERGGPVRTAPGVVIETVSLDDLAAADIDTLIVPGGLPASGIFDLDLLIAWLRDNAARVRRLCSVCTGAFLLGDAGLLDDKRATTHWSRCTELHERHPAIRLEPDRIFVNDGRLWTSGGVTAGIDLALALIEEDIGHRVAIDTARQLVVFVKRPGGQNQFSAPLAMQRGQSGRFSALNAWMAENLQADLRVERLAEKAGQSPRNFARLYTADVGRTPASAVEAMRLEAACRALEETSLPAKAIAGRVGFGTEQNLRRVMQRQFGIGPSDYRARFGRHM